MHKIELAPRPSELDEIEQQNSIYGETNQLQTLDVNNEKRATPPAFDKGFR